MLTGRPYIMRFAVPKNDIPGMDFSGIVVELGSDLQKGGGKFSVGDEVFGTADVAGGAFAEYVSVPATFIAAKPKGVSFEAAAAVPTAGMTALQALRRGDIVVTKNTRVLINGASGGVGSFAVQIAKSWGAHVTGVCSTDNVEMVRALGADEVIDYKTQDIDRMGLRFEKIVDCVGRSQWFSLMTLADDSSSAGESVAVALPETECVPCALLSILCSPWCCCCLSQQSAFAFMQEVHSGDLEELASMLKRGKLSDVGPRLSGLEAIPDALAGNSATTGLGHTIGKTVITIEVEDRA